MTYYQLFPLENRQNIWLFGYDDPTCGHQPFEQYSDLICPNCGKLDEWQAVRRGIDAKVRVKSKKDATRDMLGTDDGFWLVTRVLRRALDGKGIVGLEYHELPGDERFLLAIPERVETDVANAGVQVHGPFGDSSYSRTAQRREHPDHRCITCNRSFELTLQPALKSMVLPKHDLMFFRPNLRFEKQFGEQILMFASELTYASLRELNLKGAEFVVAY